MDAALSFVDASRSRGLWPAPISAKLVRLLVVSIHIGIVYLPLCSFAAPSVPGTPSSKSPWIRAAQSHHLDPLWLYALALQESRTVWTDGGLRPWPWTLHTAAEGAIYLESYEAALRKLQQVLAFGTRNVDVGILQVNWGHQGYRLGSAERLLRPADNIELAARILREHLDEYRGDLRLAIARYHSARAELGLPYAAAVLAILARLQRIDGLRVALDSQHTAVVLE
jgi:soluble lytic murein transglycosylase-like protein